MAKRRKQLVISTLVVVALAALLWMLLGRNGKMELRLEFVAYTNSPFSFTNPTTVSQAITGTTLCAIVLATNSGAVAVQVSAARRQDVVVIGPGKWVPNDFAFPLKDNLPRLLLPGETTTIEVARQYGSVGWFTEMRAQRRGLRDQLYLKAQSAANSLSRTVINKLLSPPAEMWAKLGPITNLPPESVKSFARP